MDNFISKTIYLEYLKCAKNAWLKFHRQRELHDFFAVSDAEQALLEKGNWVELWARKLFPKGVLIEGQVKEAGLLTASYIAEQKTTLFQATFFYDNFLVRNDVLEYNEKTKTWNLYEVKAKNYLEENSKKIDHIEDLSFQYIVLKEQGIALDNVFIIYLNKNYVRAEDVATSELFVISNITEKVKEREQHTRSMMRLADSDLLQTEQESLNCECIYKGRSAHCKTFSYSHPHVSNISVHDIARISTVKLTSLIKSGIINIEDVPDGFKLTKAQQNQVDSHKQKRPIIDPVAIQQELSKLTYPLYFLDYESYSSPIPLFRGFKPWQQIPFQFSLHVLANADSSIDHYEYLHESKSDPSLAIIHELMSLIGSNGSVIVWHKAFECMINNELGERYPEYQSFFYGLNDRVYDLEEIFKKELYVDAGFNGKTSIKKVFPVFSPKFSYKTLAIQSGDVSAKKWFDMIQAVSVSETQELAKDLRMYCHFDTIAMYEIWKKICEIIYTCKTENNLGREQKCPNKTKTY